MTQNETRFAYIAIAICLAFAGCGKKKDLGADVSIGVLGDGLILGTAVASCEDRAIGTRTRSVAKNSLVFGNFSLSYAGVGKTLFVAQIDITVTSPAIVGGSQTVTLASGEIDALLGSPGQTVTGPATATASPTVINSNSDTRSGLYPPCQLAIGGLTLADKTIKSFTATVDIEMVGSAIDANGNVERVEEKISARAEY